MAIDAELQTLLDEAITNINGAGQGPGAVDLFYAGNKTQWVQAANTLKARFFLHTAEVAGAPAYTAARAAALLGISSPLNSLRTTHGTATSERNICTQLHGTRIRP